MKINLLMISLFIIHTVQAQTTAGFEGYYYTRGTLNTAFVPKVFIQQDNGWYIEARYNYECEHSVALYGGRTFSHTTITGTTWSLTPMIGVVGGKLQGATVATNATLEIKKISFCTTIQYTATPGLTNSSFFFGWSELGYQLTDHIYAGAVLQQTAFCKNGNNIEPGLQCTFNIKDWQFPVYVFLPGNTTRTYFVAGVNKEWHFARTPHHSKATTTP